MFGFNRCQSGTSAFMALLLGTTAAVPMLIPTPASAQLFPPPSNRRNPSPSFNRLVIPRGTEIPVEYKEAEKILVALDETMDLTLTVAANIRNRDGRLLVPFGSEVVGKLEPTSGGSRFVAEEIIINNRRQYLNADSRIVTRREEIRRGSRTSEILRGASIGASAAAVIAAVTGDKAIATEEVLGGAILGTLGGLILGRSESAEVISINPNSDLDITLRSDLNLY
ncbi:MAG: hypothetical protein SAL07_05875 [Oscillatoria sp. PMC 1051.18]|uniref:hypothetical protein n=1 Tax=Oscillatoria salina TaxID=331517 RepID=UPI0013B963C9|nr:hypothetical protein [Oscillatoria salina]MBZ8179414.1 hypothetical protein [Oscillatoria salina IIICB1]MEC4892859.1 hypothetical protein [Oscillatoria sp. PMC 1050.18]MEC5029421.1 hypothetical protein [Oscillatoria sp. PMC 1051.18]NET87847.1 hypothetical protein [Kamptonema sp. SIO1D9]